MAKFLGKEHHYFVAQAKEWFWGWMLFLFSVVLSVFILVATKATSNIHLQNELVSFVAYLLLGFGIFVGLNLLIQNSRPQAHSGSCSCRGLLPRYSGLKGEREISRVLGTLPHQYWIFQDKHLYPYANIDFIVLGPTGIFIVEAKNDRGEISYENGRLIHNNHHPVHRDPINQVLAQTEDLQRFLLKETGHNFFIKHLIVYSRATVNINHNLPVRDHIYVLSKYHLNNFITSNSAYNFPIEISEVAELLRHLR